MGNFTLGLKQIYGGMKTMFGYGAKTAAKTSAKAKPAYHGPSIMDMVKRQPLALPAPTAEQLAADVPQVMVSKVLGGRNLNELRMTQEILADGSHVRYFRAPGNDKILIKMKDKGKLHQEWINSNRGKVYVKSTGDGSRYVVNKNGNFVQVHNQSVKYKDGMDQTISTNDLYYNNNVGTGFHIRQEKGFNGEQSANFDIIDTIRDSRFPDGKIEYGVKLKGPYKDGRTRINENEAPQGRLSIMDLYRRYGDDVGYKASTQTDELLKMGKENLIFDIDDAFFSSYKV